MTELGRHGYNHMIVWLDENIASPDHYHDFKKVFATTTNPESTLQESLVDVDINNLIHDDVTRRDTSFLNVPFPFILFDSIDPCLAFLQKNAGEKRIFFMTSGDLGQHIVPAILNNHQSIFQDKNGNLYEDSIYIFCANMTAHIEWARQFLDFCCIKIITDDRQMLARLTRDIAKYLSSKGEEELSNNNLSAITLALQYFSWAHNLYQQADKVRPGYPSNDSRNPINILKPLIAKAEQKLRELQTNSNDDDDGEQMSVEN
ncbi:unnamed protein product [Adineta steineri]|uniref:Uncharacterized protein n=1 Tax=Adineta steineri TaxID=433720 RepID=A0A813T7W5_9BILA|nr:unnamed protein product [Adineta steineri]CAF0921046.1 unnamed protein product [Adineta steineri]